MTSPTRLLCLLLIPSCISWSPAAVAVELLLHLPNCPAKASPAARAQTLDRYVSALEQWAEKNPDFMQQPAARTQVTLVAAHLLPEDTPFLSYERECWVFFEDARRALAAGNRQSVTQSAKAWDACLAMRQDMLRNASKPIRRCLR